MNVWYYKRFFFLQIFLEGKLKLDVLEILQDL